MCDTTSKVSHVRWSCTLVIWHFSLFFYTAQNPCLSDPCQNGGQCFAQADNSAYQCLCPSSFFGTNCQILALTATTASPGAYYRNIQFVILEYLTGFLPHEVVIYPFYMEKYLSNNGPNWRILHIQSYVFWLRNQLKRIILSLRDEHNIVKFLNLFCNKSMITGMKKLSQRLIDRWTKRVFQLSWC